MRTSVDKPIIEGWFSQKNSIIIKPVEGIREIYMVVYVSGKVGKIILIAHPKPLSDGNLVFDEFSKIVNSISKDFTCSLWTYEDKEVRNALKSFLVKPVPKVDSHDIAETAPAYKYKPGAKLSKFLKIFWDIYMKHGAWEIEDTLVEIGMEGLHIWLLPNGAFHISGEKLEKAARFLIKE